MTIQRLLPLVLETVTYLKPVQEKKSAGCIFEGAMEVLDLSGIDLIFFGDNSKEIAETVTLQYDFHDLSELQGPEVTHIFGPTQHTHHFSLLLVRFLQPSNEKLIPLEMFRFCVVEIYYLTFVAALQFQHHRHTEMHKLIVLRYDTVDYIFLQHFDYLTISLIGRHKHIQAQFLSNVDDGRMDETQKQKELLRLVLLVLQFLPGLIETVISYNRPVVAMFAMSGPGDEFRLKAIKHQPEMLSIGRH